MPYGIVHHFPGGTKEQYEASIAAVHPSRDKLPEGQIFSRCLNDIFTGLDSLNKMVEPNTHKTEWVTIVQS